MALATMCAHAQVVADTVYTGAGYANHVWYSLAADDAGTAPKNNWDLAFDVSGFGSTILVNTAIGDSIWKYPSADATGWATVDISGLSGWQPRFNSDTSWELGAMGRYANPADPTDLDWGKYNMTTHVIAGDSIYIIKVAGVGYKKLMIESLASGTYTFKYANIDGTGLQNATLAKSAYTGKNFGYYSLSTNTAADREPASANWDLMFGSYTRTQPSPYGVTGVLQNKGVEMARCPDLVDKTTFTGYATATFKTEINTIGYDWKTFNGMSYDIKDSLVFFAKPASGEIWKLIFTGFGGSTNGGMMFSKEKLYTPPVAVTGVTPVAYSMALYPNPCSGSNVTVVYSIPAGIATAQLTVTDVAGRVVLQDALQTGGGLNQYLIGAGRLTAGVYMVTVHDAQTTTTQKLIVQ